MIIFESLALVALMLWAGRDWIRKHAGICYGASTLISLGVVWGTRSGVFAALPEWTNYILPIFTQGGLAGALFIAIMYAAAVPNGSPFMKAVMPIRGELSIIASILTLGHNSAFGKTYFVRMFSGAVMPANILAAAICSLIMIVIMIPLFITSFKSVRRKMKPKSWKKLQRFAYGFYGLMYLHVLLLNLPSARGSVSAQINVLAYSVIFLSYGCMRIRKALLRKNRKASAKVLPVIGAVVFAALCCSMWIPLPAAQVQESAGAYLDGEYSGAGIGYNGQVKVAVVIENGEIVDVKVKSSVDDEPYFSDATEQIIPAVLEAQSADVDAASGATYSSQGLKNAIAAALASAQGEE